MWKILAGLAVVVGGLWAWHWYTRPAPPPPPPPQAIVVRPTPSNIKRVICPLCNGLRMLVYNKGVRTVSCPLCIDYQGRSLGYRDVKIPPGYEICPTCKGMGLVVVDQSTEPPRVNNCALCGGAGVVSAPGSN